MVETFIIVLNEITERHDEKASAESMQRQCMTIRDLRLNALLLLCRCHQCTQVQDGTE